MSPMMGLLPGRPVGIAPTAATPRSSRPRRTNQSDTQKSAHYQGILFVIDGAKALRKAIRSVFGEAPVQRCVRHKERNVLDHLPERDRPAVKQRLRRAWALEDHDRRSISCAWSPASSSASTPAPPA